MVFHTCGDQRDFRAHQRNSLGLHVRTHQGAVRIIMLKEWNERGADTQPLDEEPHPYNPLIPALRK